MFTDLPETHMFYADIMRQVKLGYIKGYEDGTVRPDEVSLGRLCAILNRKSFVELIERDILEKVSPAVVLISSPLLDGSGKSVVGSGFFITPTIVVTNQHVIANTNQHTEYANNLIGDLKLKALTDISDQHDLALLESSVANPVYFKLRTNPIYKGMRIGVLGSPLGTYFDTFTDGVVSNPSREDERGYMSLFQTDAAINAGNSGGPIIDGRGEVCGVTVSKVMGTGIEGLAFGIKVEHLRKFCETMGVAV